MSIPTDMLKLARKVVSGVPRKLYHVTPFASKIKSQGFKKGMPQVLGDAGVKAGISFTADKKWAEDYKLALQYYILWAQDALEPYDLHAVGIDFGVSRGKIQKIIDSFDESKDVKWQIKDALTTIGMHSGGRLPWMVIQNQKMIGRLASMNVNNVKIIEVTLDEEPEDYDYKSSEKEWRIYDMEALNRSKIKVASSGVQLYRLDVAGGTAVAFDVPVRLIDFKPGDRSRDTASQRSVSMIDTLKKGKRLPPIRVTKKGNGFQIYDGNARLTAYQELGRKTIPVVIVQKSGIDLDSLPSIEKSEYFKKLKRASRPSKNFHDRSEELSYDRPTTHRNMLDVAQRKREARLRSAAVPRTLWHVSNEKFRRFNTRNTAQGILWFAKDRDDLVKDLHGASINSRRPVYLYEVKTRVKNPAGWDEYDKLMLGQIRQEGYDSIDLDDDVVILDDKDVRIVNVETL